jgi:DNA primase
LVQVEGRLKADIRVITLPEGQDPDSLIRADAQQWPQLLAAAKPVVAYVLEVVSHNLDLADGKAKSAAAQQVLPLISDIADPVERDHYRHLLAEKLQIDEIALRQAQGKLRQQTRGRAAGKSQRTGHRPPEPEAAHSTDPAATNGESRTNKAPLSKEQASKAPAPGTSDYHMREGDFLRQCLQYPHVLVTVNQMLRRFKQPEVSASDFDVAEDGAILTELSRRLASASLAATSPAASPPISSVVTIEELCDDLDLSLSDRVRKLLALPAVPEAKLDRLPDTLVSSVLSWRLERLKEHNRLFGQLLREERDRDIAFTELYGEQIKLSHQLILSINKTRASLSPVARRRATRGRV